jgi:DNA-binding transcriptional regulator YdaS (Cro superfamily)
MNTTSLKSYFYELSIEDREKFAKACGTTVGQLTQIMGNHRNCNPSLAINIERESNGKVICNDLCPNVDFDYLRQSRVTKPTITSELISKLEDAAHQLKSLSV